MPENLFGIFSSKVLWEFWRMHEKNSLFSISFFFFWIINIVLQERRLLFTSSVLLLGTCDASRIDYSILQLNCIVEITRAFGENAKGSRLILRHTWYVAPKWHIPRILWLFKRSEYISHRGSAYTSRSPRKLFYARSS